MKQEKKNSRVRLILVMIVLLAALLAAIFLTDPGGEKTMQARGAASSCQSSAASPFLNWDS